MEGIKLDVVVNERNILNNTSRISKIESLLTRLQIENEEMKEQLSSYEAKITESLNQSCIHQTPEPLVDPANNSRACSPSQYSDNMTQSKEAERFASVENPLENASFNGEGISMVTNVESSQEENVNLNASMQLNTSYNTANVGKNNSAPESLAQIPDVSNKACYPNKRKNCDSNISYSLIQTKSPYNIHSQLNDKLNGYTRQRFDQNNIIKQSDYNNDQQQPIPIRITTRRVKNMGRKSNSKLRK